MTAAWKQVMKSRRSVDEAAGCRPAADDAAVAAEGQHFHNNILDANAGIAVSCVKTTGQPMFD
jgi:hypothetical protein